MTLVPLVLAAAALRIEPASVAMSDADAPIELVAPEASPEDVPVAQAEKPPDDAVEG